MKSKWNQFVVGILLGSLPLWQLEAGDQSGKSSHWSTHFYTPFTDAFDKAGWAILATGALATAVAFNNDLPMHDAWTNHQRLSEDVSKFGDFWGTGIAEGAIAVGLLLWDQPRGVPYTEGLLASTLVTFSIKSAVKRGRPDGGPNSSFPSGHTQIAFASAMGIATAYGFEYALPSFGLAVVTGLSRLSDNAHWLSDVVAGATIGLLFGRASFKHHFMIEPLALSPEDRGFGLQARFRF